MTKNIRLSPVQCDFLCTCIIHAQESEYVSGAKFNAEGRRMCSELLDTLLTTPEEREGNDHAP